jgi:hypothetical protein
MATRITTADVREVLDAEVDEPSLTAFIDDAHTVVNNQIAPYTDDRDALAAVETHLAAHIASSKEPRVQSASHESVSFEYAEEQGQKYWHNAIMMDPTGRLARPNGYPVYTTHGD